VASPTRAAQKIARVSQRDPLLSRHPGSAAADVVSLSVFVPPSPVQLFCGTTRAEQPVAGEPVLSEGSRQRPRSSTAPRPTLGAAASHSSPDPGPRRAACAGAPAPDVIAGELQISTAVFPHLGAFDACDEPEGGIIYRQAVSAVPGEWADVGPVDFGSIIGRRVPGSDGINMPDDRESQTTLRMLLSGAPIYARIVPVTANGPACDTTRQGIPGWVVFVKPPTPPVDPPDPPPGEPILEAGTGHVYRPPYFHRPSQYQPDVIHPTYDERGYRVVRPHSLPTTYLCRPDVTYDLKNAGLPYPWGYDPIGCMLVQAEPWRSGTLLNPGDRFVFRKTWSSGGGNSLLARLWRLV
jgi:hypothetical protein